MIDVANHDWYRRALEAERERANAIAQLEYEQANRRKEDANLAHERDDFIKELETANTGMRSALEAIQELHKPVKIMIGGITGWADEGLPFASGEAPGKLAA